MLPGNPLILVLEHDAWLFWPPLFVHFSCCLFSPVCEICDICAPGAFFVAPEDGTASWINAISKPDEAATAPGAELRRITLGSTVRPFAAAVADDDDAASATSDAAAIHPDSKPGLQITVDEAGDGEIVSKSGDTLAMLYTGAVWRDV